MSATTQRALVFTLERLAEDPRVPPTAELAQHAAAAELAALDERRRAARLESTAGSVGMSAELKEDVEATNATTTTPAVATPRQLFEPSQKATAPAIRQKDPPFIRSVMAASPASRQRICSPLKTNGQQLEVSYGTSIRRFVTSRGRRRRPTLIAHGSSPVAGGAPAIGRNPPDLDFTGIAVLKGIRNTGMAHRCGYVLFQ
jgi:hypothetical protein